MRSRHDAHNYGTNPTEPISVGAGTFIGIESFKLANDSNQFVFDAHKTATVTGSNGRDYLDGYAGNQTFVGGGGDDVFRFAFRSDQATGNDKIIGYNKGDRIWFNANDEG
jgi:Ca2+-binding RTX toxin-like protein